MKDKYKHAKERFLKRYKRTIETEQINAMEHLIQRNRVASMSATKNPDRLLVALRIGDEKFHCIYVKSTGDIITFIDVYERKHQKKKSKPITYGNRRSKKAIRR